MNLNKLSTLILSAALTLASCADKDKIQLETATVSAGAISETVTATGTLESVTQVDVGTQVTGKITKLFADYNSVVKKGELIAEIDKTLLESEVEAANANLESARSTYEYRKTNYERDRKLHDKKLISDYDYETSRNEYDVARLAYQKSKADRVKATENLGYAEIYAPIDGIVISREVEIGQTVVANMTVANIFTIADLDNMQVIADVDEADIGQVKVGQRVTFSVDAYPDDVFNGKVTQVRLNPTEESNVITYEVVVSADNADHKLIPGLTANITIYTAESQNALIVPASALKFSPKDIDDESLPQKAQDAPADAKAVVWTVRGGKLYPVAVTTGTNNGVNVTQEGRRGGCRLLSRHGGAASRRQRGKQSVRAQTSRTEKEGGTKMKEIIRLDGIHRNFVVGGETVHALRGVSFTINEGEFVTIMGTSGSGKSTLLNILGCLDTPTSGSYFIDGAEVQKMSRNERAYIRNRKIGFVFQNYNLLPKTTSVENVELPLFYNSAIGVKERRRRAEEALDAVGLHDRMMHKSNQMSGGQQQRVAIARALVNDPVLILADEATGNLDTRTSFSILTLFQQLHSMGRTIIFVTHNPELSDYSSRNIVLRDGKIISDERNPNPKSAEEVYKSLPVIND